MIAEKLFLPDLMLSSYRELTPALLSELGVRALISDIDNTLAPYEELDASDEVVGWIGALKEAGVSVTLVSNNRRDRVERYNRRLLCNAYGNVKKPSVKYLVAAMEDMESTPEDTIFLGDQLLTDALAAHRAGMRAVIVPPIKDKRSLFFRFKRSIERPYIKKYNKLHGKETENDKT